MFPAPACSPASAGIVTGAGSGIGRCTAHELAALGAEVALVGREIEKLEAVAQEIADAGGAARCYVADIREEERVAEVVRAVARRFRPHRLSRQQRGRTVRRAAGEDFRERLGRRRAQQSHRRISVRARNLYAVDEAATAARS